MPKVNIREIDNTGSEQQTFVENIVLMPGLIINEYDEQGVKTGNTVDGLYEDSEEFINKVEQYISTYPQSETNTVKVPDYKADVCVAFARGNVGRAKALASSEEFDNIKHDAVALLKYIRDMEISDILTAIKKISEYKMEIDDYLDIMAVWYRDVLLFKATNDINHLIFRDELPYIKKTADQSTYEGIEIIIDALETAKSRLKANVNFDLTMELLLLTMKEN